MSSTSLGRAGRARSQASWTPLAEAEFRRGIVTDTAPVALPAGAVPDARDFLFDRPGKIRKRGGTTIRSTLPSPVTGCAAVAYAPFSSTARLIAIGATPSGFSAYDASPATATLIGALGAYSSNPPVFYNNSLYIIQGGGVYLGAPAVITSTGGAVPVGHDGALMPPSSVGCVHAGYLVLANDQAAHTNRLWFSPIPDPEVAWDMSNAYIDTNGPITALASVQGVLIVFHANSSERVLGSIPPGTVGENMSLQPLSGQAGCIDAGSATPLGGNVYFADSSGVWVTNGASVTSLTGRADGTGISGLWRDSVSYGPAHGYTRAVRGGTFGSDYYLIAILDTASGGWANRLYLVYHVATGVWSRFAISAISSYAPSTDTLETYAAGTNGPHVLALSDLFAETPANASDADGDPVLPTVTSRVMGAGPFQKAFGDGHLTYDLRGSATLALTLSKDIEQQSFSAAFTFAAGTGPLRQRFPISGDGHGLSWTPTQTGASTRTEVYALEVETRSYGEQADG